MKSDKTTPNVPTLRFKQYHCPWSTYHLSDIAEVVGGGTPDTTVSSLWNGDIQWFTPTEVGHQKYVSKSARTITQLGLQKSSAKKLPAGSILLSSRATIGECSIAQRECTTNQGFQNLIPKKDTNNEFLYYLAQTKKHHFIKYASGSTFLEISNSEIKKTKCTVPGTEEQTQIAAFLSALDDRIAVQNKIISKYETLIKGICFRLLSKIEEYPTVKLSEILTEYCDKTSKNNEFPILSSTMSGIYVQSEYFNKQAASEENVGYKKIPYGYCTYRSMSDTGEFRFNIQKTVQMGIVSPAYPVFTSTIYDIDFVAFYLNKSTRLRKQIIEAKEGGTRFALSFSKLSNLTIPKIAKQQQTKMIEIYHAFLRKEDIERDYLNKLREQKSYLLSKMFI